MSHVLVTGGAGYIGSHTCAALAEAGRDPLALDNFSNAKPAVMERLRTVAGRDIPLVRADIRDRGALDALFDRYEVESVVHFAGLKAVPQSVRRPLDYYQNNVAGTITLLEAMRDHGVNTVVFSSSATVYGLPQYLPFDENHPLSCTSPYGWTKLTIERILRDLCASDPGFSAVILRYFNPIGAHPSGLLGEDPEGIPGNLCPMITQVAAGRLPAVPVTGDDYDTPDGTGVRDYLHVMDLAEGHAAALDYARAHRGAEAFNLGSGRGVSVLELLRAMERAVGRPIPYEIRPRRPGDIAAFWACPRKAEAGLGWRARRSLGEMCADAWRFQKNNPKGYED